MESESVLGSILRAEFLGVRDPQHNCLRYRSLRSMARFGGITPQRLGGYEARS